MRVLVIDDEPDTLLLCRVNLEFSGHEVLEAEDGRGGLDLALAERPDLIVLDLMLPVVDGFSVLAELSRREETREIPVILLTAMARGEDELRGWMGGASEYVTKPFSPVALTEAIERVARMSPAQRRDRRAEVLSQLAVLHRI